MKFTLFKKPVIITAPTKDEVDRAIQARFPSSWSYGTGGGQSWGCRRGAENQGGVFVLVNYQKFRRKAQVTKRKIKGERGPTFKRKVIREAHWVAYVYVFPKAMVKFASQFPRSFQVKLLPI